jgi:phosphatidylglycerophosphatase A
MSATMSAKTIAIRVWQNPIYFLAFGFGSGLMPYAPGTWGTMVAIPLYLLLMPCSLPIYLTLIMLFLIVGIWLCDKVSSELTMHDFPGIVWDEIVGYLLTMTAVPATMSWIIIGFLLFRLFDIWKPFPISWVDKKVTGGLGIMLDDVLAALPAWLILQSLIWLITGHKS